MKNHTAAAQPAGSEHLWLWRWPKYAAALAFATTGNALILGLLAVIATSSISHAGLITYDVTLTVGTGSLTGDIVTDGATGTLAQSDIVDWDLVANDGTGTFTLTGPSSGSNSNVSYNNGGSNPLSATSSELLFNFSSGDDSLLEFSGGSFPFSFTACLESYSACGGGSGVALLDSPASAFSPLTGTQAIGQNSGSGAPEPSAALFLCAGIAAIAIGLRRRKARRI